VEKRISAVSQQCMLVLDAEPTDHDASAGHLQYRPYCYRDLIHYSNHQSTSSSFVRLKMALIVTSLPLVPPLLPAHCIRHRCCCLAHVRPWRIAACGHHWRACACLGVSNTVGLASCSRQQDSRCISRCKHSSNCVAIKQTGRRACQARLLRDA
jgi:hypothetical protein